jgi:hypothetical protein
VQGALPVFSRIVSFQTITNPWPQEGIHTPYDYQFLTQGHIAIGTVNFWIALVEGPIKSILEVNHHRVGVVEDRVTEGVVPNLVWFLTYAIHPNVDIVVFWLPCVSAYLPFIALTALRQRLHLVAKSN